MRLKPYFTITLFLTAMLLVGCNQQDTSLNAPEIASVSLAPGDQPHNPGGGGGGAEEVTFTVTFSGDVAGEPYTWTRKLKAGGNIITTDPHEPIELGMTFFQDDKVVPGGGECFDAEAGTYAGPLLIGEGKKNEPGPAKVMFVFEANEVKYTLKMFGTFEDGAPWLPTVEISNTLALVAWEMGIEGNKFKDVACTGSTGEEFLTTVLVERVGALAG